MAEEFFNSIVNKAKVPKGKPTEPTLLDKLYEKPKKDKTDDKPHMPYINTGYIHQIDLLQLPNDKGFDMCLVVADVGNRLCDAEPIRNKKAATVLEAIQTIYKRDILTKPKVITCDGGPEFKGILPAELEKMDIVIESTKPGRHQKQSIVERKNQTIGTLIHKLLVHDRLASGNATSAWTETLPILIKVINEKMKISLLKKKEKPYPVNKSYKIDLLNVGDKVRVALDNPEDEDGNKKHGRFRSGDIRFSPEVREIKEVLIKPNTPVMYLLDGPNFDIKVEKVGYTRNQLQLIGNEKIPTKAIIENDEDRFEVERLVERVKVGKGYKYLVKWKGQKLDRNNGEDWVSRSSLLVDIPDMVESFDKKL
jgi:hypothetical protein